MENSYKEESQIKQEILYKHEYKMMNERKKDSYFNNHSKYIRNNKACNKGNKYDKC